MEMRDAYVSDAPGRPGEAPHVLFVDDEPGIRNLVQLSLRNAGYRVTICSHAEQAIDVYRDRHGDVDLVIVDMLMPGMSGLDALNRMKEINPDVRVVLSSVHVPGRESEDVIMHGFVDFLPKPFKPAELLDMLTRLVSGQAEVADGA